MGPSERRALPERWRASAHVVEPDGLRIALVLRAPREEQDVRFHTLCVEDAGRQSKDRVEVAFVHEIGAHLLTNTFLEENVVRYNDCRAAAGDKAAVHVL